MNTHIHTNLLCRQWDSISKRTPLPMNILSGSAEPPSRWWRQWWMQWRRCAESIAYLPTWSPGITSPNYKIEREREATRRSKIDSEKRKCFYRLSKLTSRLGYKCNKVVEIHISNPMVENIGMQWNAQIATYLYRNITTLTGMYTSKYAKKTIRKNENCFPGKFSEWRKSNQHR